MSYKCASCGIYEVEHEGDICEYCSAATDPYAQAVKQKRTRVGPMINRNAEEEQESDNAGRRRVLITAGNPNDNSMSTASDTQVYRAGEAAQQSLQGDQWTAPQPVAAKDETVTAKSVGANQPISEGITKNVVASSANRGIIEKLFTTLFQGIPFTMDPDILTFQTFPDYSGTALNASGTACDQIVLYGKINAGTISENNHVRVYGKRDSANQIIAERIENTASGAVIVPQRTISALWIRLMALAILLAIGVFLYKFGLMGFIWAAVGIFCVTHLRFTWNLLTRILRDICCWIRRIFRWIF